MRNLKPLTQEEKVILQQLNENVKQSISIRRKWLDEKMVEHSEIQIGDTIYNFISGEILGVVSELYRFWRDRDEGVRDTSLDVDYSYKVSTVSNIPYFDNTSSQTGLSIVKGQSVEDIFNVIKPEGENQNEQ